jgi:P-type Cu2+ transporter
VISAKADHTTGRVEVRESREVPENDFKSAILKAGYEYEGIEA